VTAFVIAFVIDVVGAVEVVLGETVVLVCDTVVVDVTVAGETVVVVIGTIDEVVVVGTVVVVVGTVVVVVGTAVVGVIIAGVIGAGVIVAGRVNVVLRSELVGTSTFDMFVGELPDVVALTIVVGVDVNTGAFVGAGIDCANCVGGTIGTIPDTAELGIGLETGRK
jgi:hypothetical protein